MLILGTGLSCQAVARYAIAQNLPFFCSDTRSSPPQKLDFISEFGVERWIDPSQLLTDRRFEVCVVSPGIPLSHPIIKSLEANGVKMISEIGFFAQYNHKLTIGITGSNGKSTVTKLVTEMLKSSGIKAAYGGNIGVPATELLMRADHDIRVLELSSFQLELTENLSLAAATVLNVSEDHMDRHGSMEAYTTIKRRIFNHASNSVLPLGNCQTKEAVYFGLNTPKDSDYGIRECQGETYLCRGKQLLMPTNEIPLIGQHNWMNVMAAWALAAIAGASDAHMANAVRAYESLPHRCQSMGCFNQVNWVNDSKATNVASTLAALSGLDDESVVLILGGQSKQGDFVPLRACIKQKAIAVVIYGEDREMICQVLQGSTLIRNVETLAEAVDCAKALSQPNTCVLFSPACASLDQFVNYEARGEQFKRLVLEKNKSG